MKDEYVYPSFMLGTNSSGNLSTYGERSGLTKRELFALHIFSGMVASQLHIVSNSYQLAALHADKLLETLSK